MSQHFGAGTHPDLPPFLVHFTGRPRGAHLPPAGVAQEPENRLANILGQGRLQAFKAFGCYGPVVCVSEVTPAGLQKLFSTGVTARGPYAPWALVLDRPRMIDLGFRPVWHMSDAERAATETLPMHMRDRRVGYEPGRSDWLAEREWRLCWGETSILPGHVPAVSLAGALLGVIVGKQGWDPPYGSAPVVHRGLPRSLWRGDMLVMDGYFAG